MKAVTLATATLLIALGACATPSSLPADTENAAEPDLAAFLAWLRAQDSADARYVLARFSTHSRYQMTGHAWSAFYGISDFLRRNPDFATSLVGADYRPRLFWAVRPDLQRRFAAFVRTEGHRFPGQDGGAWATKLPLSLGGTQKEGGAGSGLIARMLILLARYQAQSTS